MSSGYIFASVVLIVALVLVAMASFYGWGLRSDAQALGHTQSVRGGSLHTRSYYGGGPGSLK